MSNEPKQRAARDKKPVAATNGTKPRRGRPPKKMRVTSAETPATNGHALIAMPSNGPGRRRMVAADSPDGIAAQLGEELARELAPLIVGKLRNIADRIVRARIDAMLSKL